MDGCHPLLESGLSKSFGGSDFCLLKVAQARAAMAGAKLDMTGLDTVWEAKSLPLRSLPIKESFFFFNEEPFRNSAPCQPFQVRETLTLLSKAMYLTKQTVCQSCNLPIHFWVYTL